MINIGNFNIYPNDIDYVKLEQQGLCKDGNLNDTYFKLYKTSVPNGMLYHSTLKSVLF